MSVTLVCVPIIITSWPLIVAAVAASVSTLGYTVAAQQLHELSEDTLEYNEENQEQRRIREEITIENSEILADAFNRGESLTVEKGNIKATFHRDQRGTLRLAVDGVGLTKAELNKIGEELIGRVTQQYAYDRIVTEAKERGMEIVDETVEEDDTVKIRVRNNT